MISLRLLYNNSILAKNNKIPLHLKQVLFVLFVRISSFSNLSFWDNFRLRKVAQNKTKQRILKELHKDSPNINFITFHLSFSLYT